MPSALMYGRDSDTNKNVPIEFIQGEGMLIKDADIISAVEGVSNTLQDTLAVEDTDATAKLGDIETVLNGTLQVEDSSSASKLADIETALNGTLQVEDSNAQNTLTSIESSLASTLQVEDSNAQNTLTSIESSLANIESDQATSALQTAANNSLASIDSALAGTITTSAGVSRTNGNLAVAASVTSGGVSASVDCNNFKRFVIFGNLGASGEVIVQWSNDNSAWYDSQHQFWSNASAYDFAGSAEADARYIRVKYGVTGSVTVRYALSA